MPYADLEKRYEYHRDWQRANPEKVSGYRSSVQDSERARLALRARRRRRDAYLTREKLDAAWRLYQAGLSMPMLAELLWQLYGYSSPESCRTALYRAFRKTLGRRPRTRVEAWTARKAAP